MRAEKLAKFHGIKRSLAGRIRRRVKRFLSVAVSASVIACSMPAVPVMAATGNDVDVQEFTLTVNDLCDAVEKALLEDEPVSESAYVFEGEAQEAYDELFYGTDVYEIEPAFEKDGGNDLRLKIFVRPGDGRELDSAEITGDEEIIFLLLNNSREEAAARIVIDEYDTGLITVVPRGDIETAKAVAEEISIDELAASDNESAAENGSGEAIEADADEDDAEAVAEDEAGYTETDEDDAEEERAAEEESSEASEEPDDQKDHDTSAGDSDDPESENTGSDSDREDERGEEHEAGKESGDDDKDTEKPDSGDKSDNDDKADGNADSADSGDPKDDGGKADSGDPKDDGGKADSGDSKGDSDRADDNEDTSGEAGKSSHRSSRLRASLDHAEDPDDDETTAETEEDDDEIVITFEDCDDEATVPADDDDTSDEAVIDDSEVIIIEVDDDEPDGEETDEVSEVRLASVSNAAAVEEGCTLLDGETYDTIVVNHSKSGVGYVTTLRSLGIDYGIRLLADGPEARIGEDIYETLALAIDAADEGDTITLINNVTVSGTSTYAKINKSLTIDMAGFNINVTEGKNYVFEMGTRGITFVLTNSEKDGGVIDGKPDGSETSSDKAAVYSSSKALNISINNIVIQNFNTNPIYLAADAVKTEDSFELKNCTIRNNVSTGYAGGLRLHFFDSVVIKDSEISGNEAVRAGGGIYLLNCSDIDIEGNTFKGNIANTPQSGLDYYGGGAFCIVSPGGNITVKDNKVTDNTAEYLGGGFTIYSILNADMEMGDVLIEGNTVTGNRVINGVANLITAQGGGIAVIDENTSHSKSVHVTFSDNKISENIAGTDEGKSSYDRGGGLSLAGFSENINFYIISGEITDNKAAWGGGIDYTFKETSTLYLYNTLVTENEAVRGGGVWLCPTSITDMSTTFGGAIYDNSASGRLRFSDGHTIDSSGDDICYESSDSTIIEYLIKPGDDPNKDPQFLSSKATVIAEALGGHMIDWYEDGDGDQHRYTEEHTLVDVAKDYKDRRASFGLHAELDQQGKYFAEACAEVIISGNEATMFGGGIASNARMYFGDEYDTYPVRDITVTKSWLDTEGRELSSAETENYSVDISLIQRVEDLGLSNKLMTVNLSNYNDWTYKFENLATKYIDQNLEVHDCDYTVEESNVAADRYFKAEIIPGNVEVIDNEGNSKQTIEVTNTEIYREFFEIDEEIIRDQDMDESDPDNWDKEEPVDEYTRIEFEMATLLPALEEDDLNELADNGSFTLRFHNVFDDELKPAPEETDLHITINGITIDPEYYTVDMSPDEDGCSFHVTVDLGRLYLDDNGIDESCFTGETPIMIFFYADLEGAEYDEKYESIVWYEVYDNDDQLFESKKDVVWVYTSVSTGDLTISKTVTGGDGDPSQEFTFTLTLSDASINGTYGDLTFVDGVAEFTLKDGETKTAVGLPGGIEYTVTETPVNGYTTTSEAASGRIVAGDTINVTYINDKPSTSSTTDGGGHHSGGGSSGGSRSGGSALTGPGAGEDAEGELWELLPMPATGEGKAVLFGVCALALSAMALTVLLWLRRKEI